MLSVLQLENKDITSPLEFPVTYFTKKYEFKATESILHFCYDPLAEELMKALLCRAWIIEVHTRSLGHAFFD